MHANSVVGGMPVGPDGRIHTTFTRNANTLRLTSVGPNLQNIPRGGELGKLVKEIFVAPPGYAFWARDYAGIEAKLVGVAASDPDYTRLSGIDIHSYFTAYKLAELDHVIPTADLPSLSWSDADLAAYLKGIKQRYPADRQALKHVGHLANYMGGASKAQEVLLKELGVAFPVKDVQKMMDVYFAIFPRIPEWHRTTCLRVDGMKKEQQPDGSMGVCFLKNPYGFIMRFHNVLQWSATTLTDGTRDWTWSYGKEAKALIAAWPQSTAAFIYCEAMLRLEEQHPDVAATIRLMIHDELLGEAQKDAIETCLHLTRLVMEQPIPEIPLDPSWGLGSHLVIKTEGKTGPSWANMTSAD